MGDDTKRLTVSWAQSVCPRTTHLEQLQSVSVPMAGRPRARAQWIAAIFPALANRRKEKRGWEHSGIDRSEGVPGCIVGQQHLAPDDMKRPENRQIYPAGSFLE